MTAICGNRLKQNSVINTAWKDSKKIIHLFEKFSIQVMATDISRGRGAAKFRQIREIHKNTQNTAKFARNRIKYMSVQQF